MKKNDLVVLACLRRDARMKLTEMSRLTRVPVSTCFDRIRALEGDGVVRKHGCLVDFRKLGFQARALAVLNAHNGDKDKLLEFLKAHPNVNSLFRVNGGWHLLAELVFPGVREVEDFFDEVEAKFRLKDKKVFYVLDEFRREEFLSNPSVLMMAGGSA
jgi:Lrp/AsnC family leucine-responsive transcriptional regulator